MLTKEVLAHKYVKRLFIARFISNFGNGMGPIASHTYELKPLLLTPGYFDILTAGLSGSFRREAAMLITSKPAIKPASQYQ